MTNIFDKLIERAKKHQKRIVLTESEDERILQAVSKASDIGLCKVILLGDESLKKRYTKKQLENIEIIDVSRESEKKQAYQNMLFELRKAKGMTEQMAKEQVNNKLNFAMLMLRSGDADGVVSGAINHTADVLRSAFQIVKPRSGVGKVSSVFIMESPDAKKYGENGFLVFADCGVNPNPTDEDLAEIAILSSETAQKICGITPRVALLSYSSKSGDEMTDENVCKVKRALKIIKEKQPNLIVDGELQADASLVKSVADQKAPSSPLEGRANVLIFPDLNAGNIAYKLVQRLAGVKAIGPVLQGLNQPVNDLSRGTSVDEIILDMAVTILQSK